MAFLFPDDAAAWPLVVAALCLWVGCAAEPVPETSGEREAVSDPVLGASRDSLEGAEAGLGETVYVPVYSHIFHQTDGRQIDLTATVSVRNTDPVHPLRVRTVNYYDSDGRLVRRYLDAPVVLGPLASRAYVVEERDRTGGVGANVLVGWEAEGEVSAPLVEAVMISTASNQGISFVSRGYPVRSADG